MENDLITANEELNTLINYFEDYETNTIDIRIEAERDRDYYDNKQYTDVEITTLNSRKQPIVTFNLVKRTVDAILGMERLNRTDPKAYPRTPQHEDDAEAITDALRYIADNNDFDQTASAAFTYLLIEGTEAIDVYVKEKGGEYEVQLYCIDWDRYFYDIHSRKKDFSDSKYHGITIWMDLKDAVDRWPESKEVLESSFQAESNFDDTFDDAPRTVWVSKDQDRKRLRINQIYYKKKGTWYLAFYTKGGFVEKPKESPYLDENGDPEDSIVSASAYVDRDGNRYGYVRQLISPQDEVNKRRSKALHHISQRQTFGNKRSGVDASTVKSELAKPDGHVDMTNGEFGKDFGIIPTQDMAMGNFQLLQEAKDMFNSVGTNTSVTGVEDRVRSGRAEQFRQLAGTRELAPVFDMHQNVKRRVYRKIWNRIKQYWTGERWIRVTDDEKNLKWVGINSPLTVGDQMAEEGLLPENWQQTEIAQDPRLSVPIGTRNKLSELDVDIILEESPDYVNIQQEQFELIAQLFQGVPEAIPVLVEMSQLRNKDQILEKLQGDPEQQQQASEQAEQERQIAISERMAKIGKDQQSAEKDAAQASKAEAEAVQTNAQTALGLGVQ